MRPCQLGLGEVGEGPGPASQPPATSHSQLDDELWHSTPAGSINFPVGFMSLGWLSNEPTAGGYPRPNSMGISNDEKTCICGNWQLAPTET